MNHEASAHPNLTAVEREPQVRPEDLEVTRPGQSYLSVTEKVSDIVLRPTSRRWWIGFGVSVAFVGLFFMGLANLFISGIGIWGINTSVVWGFAIVNYVWWIGIGNAGTLISALLYLTRQPWRTSTNRFAEVMTLFAAMIAGIFPIIHLGRPDLFFWLAPYPNTREVFPQFRSPLVWDFFAISTYILVSFMFWYTGLIPDFGTIRDRATSRMKQVIYGILALGWRGSASHWQRLERAYIIMAALAVPLVVSVHSVVGYDFSVNIMPAWSHSMYAPWFVIGAAFSGFAMVMTLTIILRHAFKLHAFVTLRHLEAMAKIMIALSLVMGYSYATEVVMAFYGGEPEAKKAVMEALTGDYAVIYWMMIGCNVLVPQLFWFRRLRLSIPVLLVVALLINFGMWLERLFIVVSGLGHGYLPSQWGHYWPTIWDWAILLGSLGIFVALFFLFVRFIPMIPMHDMRKLIQEREPDVQ